MYPIVAFKFNKYVIPVRAKSHKFNKQSVSTAYQVWKPLIQGKPKYLNVLSLNNDVFQVAIKIISLDNGETYLRFCAETLYREVKIMNQMFGESKIVSC